MQDGYYIQDACHKCKHVFEYKEVDCGPTFYCTKDAPECPLCGSVSLGESFDKLLTPPIDPVYEEWNAWWHKNVLPNVEAWSKWTQFREVHDAGICPNYEE